jgi:hypothetical protein
MSPNDPDTEEVSFERMVRVGSTTPRVAVGTRYMRGAETWPPGKVETFQLCAFEEAFTAEWDIDAHFVTYDVIGKDGVGLPEFPRLKKSSEVVAILRDIGCEIVQTMFALDYDNPEHAAWTPEAKAEFESLVTVKGEIDPLIVGWQVYYTTKHGARFVYVLKDPIPVGPETEAMHRSLVRLWGQQGIKIDPACSDWTRFFRLPRVTRE